MATQITEKPLFEVPPELLERGGAWPPPYDLKNLYQLPVSGTNIGMMLEDILETLPQRVQEARRRGLESPGWGNLISVKNFPDSTELFEPISGALRIPDFYSLPEDTLLRGFYEKAGRVYVENGYVENRGPRYYAIADHDLSTPESKLAIMQEDIKDSLKVINDIDRTKLSETEYLLYLGVTDVLKQNALALFHALTFPERAGNHARTPEYEQYKQIAWNFARSSTRIHYQTLLGREHDAEDSFSSVEIENVMKFFLSSDPHIAQFKLQEIDHPLLIALSAHESALTHPQADTIVAMPSGGTQIGIVTQLMYEIHPNLRAQRKHAPKLITIPLSTHSGRIALSNEGFSFDELVRYIRERYINDIQGKYILVTEDNANRGKTAEMIHTALMAAYAQTVHISLAELDPHRVIFKQRLPPDERPRDVLNMTHHDFSTVVGVVPMEVIDGTDQQRRKIRARKVIASARR